MPTQIAFLGAGRMASAIIQGLIQHKHYAPQAIACTCGDDPSGPELAAATGISYTPDLTTAIREAHTLVLACKPQQLAQIDPAIAQAAKGKLILSILAGTTLNTLQATFPEARNYVRTMPNTPGQIGAGVTAYTPAQKLDTTDQARVKAILTALGNYHQVEESQLDAVTALSGSGPAYIFEFAAALRQAGIALGLDPALAHSLAIQTVYGSAALLAKSDQDPEALRDAVTSKGGTTAAALQILSDHDLRALIEKALTAARDRSIELAKQ
jgi:pyrroline-5-carboxylate reductase